MPLSIYQIPLQKRPVQADFHSRNNSIIILYDNGELQSISSEGKESRILSFSCEPVSFKINADGDLAAVLGRGKLFLHNFLTMKTIDIEVDEKIQLLDFHKNSALLGGYQNSIIQVRSNGTILKTLKFDFLIRQFKMVPLTGHILIYNQDHKLLSADMSGNILWLLENLIIHDEILVCRNGDKGYFILDPNDLIQFHVRGDYFYEVGDETGIKAFSPSMDGKYLLVLDSENTLKMYDEKAFIRWESNPEHDINQIKLSPKGDFFFTIDSDDVLNCFATNLTERKRGDFFEITGDKRVLEKECAWSVSPGGNSGTFPLSLLTVSAEGDAFGLMGRDGCIHFYDEGGVFLYHASFTAMVECIGIGDHSQYGYVYGGNEVMILFLRDKRKQFILFEKSIRGRPIVNYHHQRVFTLTREGELFIHDFKGRVINAVHLEKECQGGISCEAHGIILFNDQGISGFSIEGKALFTYPVKGGILNVFYSEPLLICSTKDRGIFTIDFSSFRGKQKRFGARQGTCRIVSANPLFIVKGSGRLHHLDSELSPVTTHRIESPDSLFFLQGNDFFEIVRKSDRFYCYNDKRRMTWRHVSNDSIKESALTRSGLVFISGDEVRYLETKNRAKPQRHFSQYLEI